MKTAKDYPVSFPYGATSSPYSKTNPHKGEDRAMPLGTPVVVNGTKIGEAGTTGKSTGVHVHVQKVLGKVLNPKGAGFDISLPAVVYQTGYRSDIGNYVRIRDAKGVEWSYFHMNKVMVKKGQIIEGDEMLTNKDHLKALTRQFLGKDPSKDLLKYIGKPYAYTVDKFYKARKDLPTVLKQNAEMAKALKIKDNEISRLKAQVGDASAIEMIKQGLKQLLGIK